MSYTKEERDAAILSIGDGVANLKNVFLLEELASFRWITLEKTNDIISKATLTYSGEGLFKSIDRQRHARR